MVEFPHRSPVEETRTRILTAARELFARKGSRGMTTREVAERAEVNEATLFRHFGTKQQLLQAMLDHCCGTDADQHQAFLDRLEGPLEEQLRAILLRLIERITERRDLILVGMAEEAMHPDSSMLVWRGPTIAQQQLGEYMRRKIASGALRGDALEVTRAFMSLAFAYVMARKIWQEAPADRERAIAFFVDIFLNGARVR